MSAGGMARSISELVIDVYAGNVNNRQVIEVPSWTQVADAIRSLDGQATSSMAVLDSEDNVLTVGGGAGVYNVSYTDASRCYTIVNKHGSSATVNLIIGGTRTSLPARYLVDLDTALSLARRFYENALVVPSEDWE